MIKTNSNDNFTIPAEFLIWGIEGIEFNNGSGINQTVAIVRLEDGTLRSVCPEWVKFLPEEKFKHNPEREKDFNSGGFLLFSEILKKILDEMLEKQKPNPKFLDLLEYGSRIENTCFSELINQHKKENTDSLLFLNPEKLHEITMSAADNFLNICFPKNKSQQ